MKLNLLYEKISGLNVASLAKSKVEKAGFDGHGKQFVGDKGSVRVNYNPKDKKMSGIQWHVHPIRQSPTKLGVLPSAEPPGSNDIESSVRFMMRTGHDKFNPKSKVVMNDPSDIEGFAIIHGPYTFYYAPGKEVDLSKISDYIRALKKSDPIAAFDEAIRILNQIGFETSIEYDEKLAKTWSS